MRLTSFVLLCGAITLIGCNSGDDTAVMSATESEGTTEDGSTSDDPSTDTTGDTDTGETGDPPELDAFVFANGCYAIKGADTYLAQNGGGDAYAFGASLDGAARFYLKASDLGTYLFYDQDGGYLVSDDGPLLRQTSLQSDVMLIDDEYVSGAEWLPETSELDWELIQLRNRRNDLLMTEDGLGEDGLPVTLEATDGCTEHPELTLDATGSVGQTTFDDGDLYGIVDTHSHILSNFAFGGGGIFHGEAFHRLGVEHAMRSCETSHGVMGRKDFFGYAFDTGGSSDADLTGLLPDLIGGELTEDNHATEGYPTFTDWPNGPSSSTHQTQYYKWLERAYLSGLRLVVQHATTNSVICNFMVGEGLEPARYDCNDMLNVDRIIDETYAMERYIDAQAGGPGEGFFRVVNTPADARAVIEGGKMAVVLGIETSDLFDCFITPKPGYPACTADYVREELDYYYSRGVRVLFPVHKYDNAFTPGDGNRAFIELGNFLNSGHWGNFTEDCPVEVTDGFDKGDVFFGGLNAPRNEYLSPAPNDTSNYPNQPVTITSLYLNEILGAPLVGDYCQNATMTELGETLMMEMMQRGMVIEVDHLPQWSYKRAFEMLVENDYPAVGTHGRNFNGLIYQLGGLSTTGFGRCRQAGNPGSTVQGFLNKIQLITDNGGYPAEGFGFDLNGFAGARGPRFDSNCADPQDDPITYPFSSYAGDVEFTEPAIGDRTLDFNTEGLVHIGLLPELIEDARRDAIDEADLEPLFRSAEAYIRVWERSEERGAALAGG